MTQIELTPSQRAVLELAVETDGRVENFPKNLGGGARAAVMRGLLLNGLIVADGAVHTLTDAGYEAVGRPAKQSPDLDGDAVAEDQPVASADSDPAESGESTSGEGVAPADKSSPLEAKAASKKKWNRVEQVVAMLMRTEGATIAQVMAATSWQPHSVRGFFAGTLKKKGFEVTSSKEGKEERVYRITADEVQAVDPAAE